MKGGSFLELSDLIESIDIVDYISQYVDLSEKNGEFWGLSPFKEEKTPSFSVRRETSSFYDFSSGIGGNVLTFVRYFDKCGYSQAIEKLKAYSGVTGEIAVKKRFALSEIARRFSPPRKTQKQGKPTILPDDYMVRYEKNEEKLAAWEAEGISRESLDKFQVYYDEFSDRLVYPIRDPDGKIVNVGGRTLDPEWKTKNLRKYTYFQHWGTMNTIYGLAENKQEIRRKREIILYEGCKSVLIADTWGIHNAGAILTSHLNENQMKLLVALGCTVVFALDKDVNIREDRHIAQLKQFVNVEYVFDKDSLLDAKDSPVDKGPDVWHRLYEGRLSWR